MAKKIIIGALAFFIALSIIASCCVENFWKSEDLDQARRAVRQLPDFEKELIAFDLRVKSLSIIPYQNITILGPLKKYPNVGYLIFYQCKNKHIKLTILNDAKNSAVINVIDLTID